MSFRDGVELLLPRCVVELNVQLFVRRQAYRFVNHGHIDLLLEQLEGQAISVFLCRLLLVHVKVG